ncbi:hypothetical protein Tco_0660478 [Tanacetum coccineum]
MYHLHPHDSTILGGNIPGSDEGRMELIKELMETCTSLTKRVLSLEEAKIAQDRVINRLKLRVKRLEKKTKARTPQPMKRRLFKGGVETSTDTSLGEDASKQGRSSDKTKPMPEVSAATPSTPPTIATVFDDEDVTMAMAQTLIKLKKVKRRDQGLAQIESDAELAQRLHEEELEELDRAKKERQRQEEATNAALTEEFDDIQARTDADALFAAKLQQEERESNLPLKKEHNFCQLKGKTYEEIHELYERQQKRNQYFIPIDSEKEAQKSEKEAAEYEKEKEELRADGSSSYHGDMQAFLRRLDRQDLNDLYRLVQERFQDHPLKGHDLLLWGDLRMIFDTDEKDEVWMNQLDWKLHENCGVHTLFMDGTPMEINMLVEKKYPLIKELLEKVLNLQLEAEEESATAFKLIKFIKSMLEE